MAFRSRGQCIKIGDPGVVLLGAGGGRHRRSSMQLLKGQSTIGLLMSKREGMLDDGMGVMRTQRLYIFTLRLQW